MSHPDRQLHLNLFIYPSGHHEASWRHPQAQPERALDIRFYQQLAQQAEAAHFDAVFFADSPSLPDNIRYGSRFRFEPITWLAGIAAATERIGLVATASTSYYEPYNLARLFATLDHLSQGRAGWNIVTTSSADAAANFGLDAHPGQEERYARAEEFVQVVTALWDSWEDDALVVDKASGLFAEDSRVHPIEHVGRYYRVKGPFNLPRSPQGRPVYVQAGSSEDGREFAARHAEAIFTAHQTLESATRFATDIRQRALRHGRGPNAIRVLPGISPIIAGTEAEALRLADDYHDLIQPAFSLTQLGRILDTDLHGYDLDAPFPLQALDLDSAQSRSSRFQVVLDIVQREQPTLRGLIRRLAGARGHWTPVGTPEQIADLITSWHAAGAADGFNVMPPSIPADFSVFVQEVVPILQRRGLFRTAYQGTTLRDHYGLARPASQFSRTAAAAA